MIATWLRRRLPGMVAALVIVIGYFVVNPPTVSADEQNRLASRYRFTPMSIALPAASKQQSQRTVNQAYEHIRAWISSVGAAVAMNDLDGDGLDNDLCLVYPRTDQVVITPAPGRGQGRYQPFALEPKGLPMDPYIAPMGCAPGDFNEDGRMDLLVYYWGRTPILFLARPTATRLDADAYQPTELVPHPRTVEGRYAGPQWNTNAATVADFDGDGHQDIFIANYFPDGPVLDPHADGGVVMDHSLSHARNSGGKYIFRWTGASAGAHPSVSYQRLDKALPAAARRGWTLACSATDVDGDGLPELYIANDFGRDRMLYNESTPGHVKFLEVKGVRGAMTPKSKVIGDDSFKGMGVDFADLNHDGLYDMFVSNITTTWGIQESNFQWMNTATSRADLRSKLRHGVAPWVDRSAEDGTAWSGWGWDVKIADFNNSGNDVITQATGFVKGHVNRWPQLQELATANDALVTDPDWWPNVRQSADIAGDQTLHFFVKDDDGHYVDIAGKLGLAVPVPTRGIATGDADGDGRLDFAVARQWAAPVFYHNDSPNEGSFLGLKLTYDTPTSPGPLPAAGSPVIGAEATVRTPDGRTFIDRVDGGSGHSGKRSTDIHIGLGHVSGPLRVHLLWRDRAGRLHQQDLVLSPGQHALRLGTRAKER